MKTSIDCVVFTFPTLCGTCQQELYDDSEDETINLLENKLTVMDICNAGWPVCSECGNDCEVDNDCDIRS